MSRKPLVYLAGSDIFRSDAETFTQCQIEICEKYNLEALHAVNNYTDIGLTDKTNKAVINLYESNMYQMLEADVICANMNQFRGSEPESGTCFVTGFFAGFNEAIKAMGMAIPTKPIYAYIDVPLSYKKRAEIWCKENPMREEAGPDWKIREIEKYLNLMIEASIYETGAFITTGFEDCIKQISQDFTAEKFKING